MVDKDPNGFNARAGIRVRQLREAAGLNQDELVDRLALRGISFRQSQVSRLERGLRVLKLDEAAAFAGALNVDLGALLSETDDVEIAELKSMRWKAQAEIAERRKIIADAERGIQYYGTVIENLNSRLARLKHEHDEEEEKTA